MQINFSGIGEHVIFTGSYKYALDDPTSNLMFKHLVIGGTYTVATIAEYSNRKDMWHYKFHEIPGWYPCESFVLDMVKKFGLK